MNTAYLLIGGNIGDRLKTLSTAKEIIGKTCGLVVKQSSVYQTAAWGLEKQDDFLNQVIEIQTTFDAASLLEKIQGIEKDMGRSRELRYGPRIIDIDILFFNLAVIQEHNLIIPHPQLPSRRFALVPMAEIAPTLVHPILQKTVSQLLEECKDMLAVQKFP